MNILPPIPGLRMKILHDLASLCLYTPGTWGRFQPGGRHFPEVRGRPATRPRSVLVHPTVFDMPVCHGRERAELTRHIA